MALTRVPQRGHDLGGDALLFEGSHPVIEDPLVLRAVLQPIVQRAAGAGHALEADVGALPQRLGEMVERLVHQDMKGFEVGKHPAPLGADQQPADLAAVSIGTLARIALDQSERGAGQ
jgi:hypothetical protein